MWEFELPKPKTVNDQRLTFLDDQISECYKTPHPTASSRSMALGYLRAKLGVDSEVLSAVQHLSDYAAQSVARERRRRSENLYEQAREGNWQPIRLYFRRLSQTLNDQADFEKAGAFGEPDTKKAKSQSYENFASSI
jgi:hypothetical protein